MGGLFGWLKMNIWEEAAQQMRRPDVWKKRRPQKHSLDHYFTLPDAIDFWGKKKFKKSWSGQEWYARSKDKIMELSLDDIVGFTNTGLKSKEDALKNYEAINSMFENQEAEIASFERKNCVLRALVEFLIKSETHAVYFENHSKKQIHAQRWEAEDSFDIFETGSLLGKTVYLLQDDLKTLAKGKKPIKQNHQKDQILSKGGRPKEFQFAKYAAILAVLHGEEDMSKLSQEKVYERIHDVAVRIWPDEKLPSQTWMKENLLSFFSNFEKKIKDNLIDKK